MAAAEDAETRLAAIRELRGADLKELGENARDYATLRLAYPRAKPIRTVPLRSGRFLSPSAATERDPPMKWTTGMKLR